VSSLTIEQARLSREVLVRELAAMTHGSWDPRFQGDVIPCIRFIVARAIALVSDKIDCEIGFDRFPVSGITVMNPVLRQRLECDPLYDSVPLSIGRSARGSSLWDGHRRLETYRSAGRPDFPAWIASFRPGAGLLRVVD
jgi:hypothetical protein